ncbi:MAG: arsenate reductase ArsC [Deltaproteobacteria bacterium]|nr:arsenate reductase ArsC [Deltaproteobacteria bacterium]
MAAPKKILFICVGNTCRSQMAEGFARRYGNGLVDVKSAGTAATGYVNEETIEAMREEGIDISAQSSRQVTNELIKWAEMVVTLGGQSADSICPADYMGGKIDWPIKDPLGRPRELMEMVKDDIHGRVKDLIEGLAK